MNEYMIIDRIENLNMKYGFTSKLKLDINYLFKQGYQNKISKIYIFGSCSRGEESYLSDIDLGVITKYPLDRRTKSDIRSQFTDITEHGIETNPVFINENELDLNIRLHKEITEGIEIYKEE